MIRTEWKLKADFWVTTSFWFCISVTWTGGYFPLAAYISGGERHGVWIKLLSFCSSRPLEWFSTKTFGFIEAVETKMPSVKLNPCQKSSTDEHSGLNIPDKKGKKMKQSNWHILAKDVNMTDWMELMILLSNIGSPFILVLPFHNLSTLMNMNVIWI